MRRRATGFSLIAAMMLVVMAMSGTAFAKKLVVLSFPFNGDTQGFTASIGPSSPNGRGCHDSVSTSWENGTLAVSATLEQGCTEGRNVFLDKLVVLLDGVQNPGLDMVISDPNNALNINGCRTIFTAIASPNTRSANLIPGFSSRGWTPLSALWSDNANSGSSNLEMVIPLRSAEAGSTSIRFYVDNVQLSSN